MNIQLLDYRGQTWHLAGDDEGAEGVTLGKISNTVGAISNRKDKDHSRFRPPSPDIGELDPIEPTLTVQVATTPELTVETVIRRFLNGLDFFKPAKLIVTESRQPSLCLFVHLSQPVGLPEDTTALDNTTMEVELTAKDGCWFGPQRSGTGIVAVENTGDIPLWPTVRWHGMAARFTEDRNGLIVLPPALGRSGLTYYTDPATGGLVTDNQGYPNNTAWATMRGVAWSRPVMPGDGTTVECHHCQVLWRNRYLSPWAQSGGSFPMQEHQVMHMAAIGQRRRDDHTPFVYLTDKYLTPQVVVTGYTSLKASDKVNDAGAFTLEVPANHPMVDVLIPPLAFDGDPNSALRKLTDIQQFLVVEYGHARYTYFVDTIVDHAQRTNPTVEISGASIYEMTDYLVMESNPMSIKALQPKYMDVRAGDSLRVIKTFILMNLRRLYQFDLLPDPDPWSPVAWRDYADWPIMVNSLHRSVDTPWTVLAARFDSLADLTKETLEAAGLRLTITLWMPWDRQPFPTHTRLWKPTFIIDVVPVTGDSSVAGHIREGVKNIKRRWDPEDNVSTVGMSSRSNPDGYKPWVTLRPDHIDYATSDVTITRSQYADVTVGGKSPGAVNQLLKRAAASFVGGAIAGAKTAWPGHDKQLDDLQSKLGKAGETLTEDKLLAFSHHQATRRAHYLGPYRRRELVASGEGFTVEGEQQAFEALAKGKGGLSAAFKIADGCPYTLGYEVNVGDQIGVEWREMVLSTWVDEATLTCTDGRPPEVELAVGEARARRFALQQLNVNQKHISSVTKRLKTLIG